MLRIDKFAKDDVTWELDSLLYDSDSSLYTFHDMVRMRPEQFEVSYTLRF